MSRLFFVWLLGCSVGLFAQSAPAPASTPASAPASAPTPSSQTSNPTSSPSSKPSSPPASTPGRKATSAPPRSDRINADALGDAPGQSSSKDEQVDLSPPPEDVKAHPKSSEGLIDGEALAGDADTAEFRPWDPHKAAKDVEVGDYYFKRKNYIAAESRYREALLYKENDAIATFRLAVCLEKLERPDEALEQYDSYLKILPHGPEAPSASKAISRLRGQAASAKSAK